jgi:phosphatidate cytidylyltransferase
MWFLAVVSLCSFYLLYNLPVKHNVPAGGQGLLFFVVVLTQANDIFQFLWGKSIGKRKILPAISPHKTWGGFLGAIASSAILSLLAARFFMDITFFQAMFCGALISILGFWGDITMSTVKRKADIKDMGNILPGHGGIMDRIDSLIYTMPLFLCFSKMMFY